MFHDLAGATVNETKLLVFHEEDETVTSILLVLFSQVHWNYYDILTEITISLNQLL